MLCLFFSIVAEWAAGARKIRLAAHQDSRADGIRLSESQLGVVTWGPLIRRNSVADCLNFQLSHPRLLTCWFW